ncbi:MAG TPA: hypothetical protein VNT27_03625 [Propionibacteriaceae bacterium]|nr:hypothetical protein [Propionibacteriaceae bacterium]
MSEKESSSAGDRLLQLIAVVLLGITTIGTAWCGFQASRWNGHSGDLNGVASARRVEGSRLFGLATQRITYDSMVVAKYAEAGQARNVELQKFYRESVVRPDFLPFLDRWEAAVKAGDPAVGVFEDKEYLAGQFAAYDETVVAAEQATTESQKAGEAADAYVGTTILLAVALFFAGIESSFRFRVARLLLLLAATGAVAVAAARLVDLPVI